MSTIHIKLKKLRENASVPAYQTPGAAACDLCAAIDAPVTLAAGQSVLIPTGIAIEPENNSVVALIFARSGLAVRHGIALSNGVGVVDADYRGEICVGLTNHSSAVYQIRPGERVAQLMFVQFASAVFTEADGLNDTERGAGGFGHSGK